MGNGDRVREPFDPPEYVVIGRVTRPHGIAGEVRVMPVDTTADRLLEFDTVYLNQGTPRQSGPRRRRFTIERARVDRGHVLLKLEEVESRDRAEELRGALVEIPGSLVRPLPEGEYYVFELVGCRVVTVGGDEVGEVTDVLPTGANDVYVVRKPDGRDVLVPAVKAMVKSVDVSSKRIVIDPWPGLLDD